LCLAGFAKSGQPVGFGSFQSSANFRAQLLASLRMRPLVGRDSRWPFSCAMAFILSAFAFICCFWQSVHFGLQFSLTTPRRTRGTGGFSTPLMHAVFPWFIVILSPSRHAPLPSSFTSKEQRIHFASLRFVFETTPPAVPASSPTH